MPTRRQFLKIGSLTGAAALVSWKWSLPRAFAATQPLTKYLDPLPIPPVMQPVSGVAGGAAHYEVAMSSFTQQLHTQLDPTPVWGYGDAGLTQGSYPSATIEARRDVPIQVKWINNLPQNHFLPVDKTLDNAKQDRDVRTAVHLHGGHVPPESDGGPLDTFLPGDSRTLAYPNSQRATTLWYHDHALAITRLNVYAGLAGFYLLRDDEEDGLNLPSGDFEIPLVIQDRMFNADGSLFYPSTGQDAPPPVPPVWVPEFFGDTILVNGKVWPYLEVEPRKYRFRFLNGSQARFYSLQLSGSVNRAPGPVFYQIGNEGGLLPSPVLLNDRGNSKSSRLLMAPAERADVIIDFADFAGQTLILRNAAKAPFPEGDTPDPNTTGQVMQFRVGNTLSQPDTSSLPSSLPAIAPLPPASLTRDLTLQEFLDEDENPIRLLLEGEPFSADTTTKPRLNTTEVWRLINTTGDTHPIHLHLVQFEVLDRQKFDVRRYLDTGQLSFHGVAKPADANEAGRKDTVRANPGEVTRIRANFDILGKYVWHCHILEHEDNDMMRPFEVVP